MSRVKTLIGKQMQCRWVVILEAGRQLVHQARLGLDQGVLIARQRFQFLHGGTIWGQSALQSLPTKDIKAVVVLTDGIDNHSTLHVDQLVNAISASGENAGNAVKVFTIAYGSDADTSDLTKIASATGGQECTGTPQNIRQVYIQISEFF